MIRTWIIVIIAVTACLGELAWRELPSDTVVFEGDIVRLRCATATALSPSDHHHWVRLKPDSGQQLFLSDGVTLAPTLNPDIRSRFSLRANHAQGIYELTIGRAQVYDSGEYGCIIYNRQVNRRSISRFGKLSVVQPLIPAGSPQCTLLPAHPGPGDLVTFTCSSLVDNALSGLNWTRGDDFVPSTSVLNEEKRRVVTFHRRLRDSDNHAVYTCSEQYPLANSPVASCSLVPFDIPMNVTLHPVSVRTVVGTNIIFSCQAASVPPVTKYWWLFDGHPVEEKPDMFQLLDGGRRLKIRGSLSPSETQYEVRCKVQNILDVQRSAIGYIRVLATAAGGALNPGNGLRNETIIIGRSNKVFPNGKSATTSDNGNLPEVRGNRTSILFASTAGVGATLLLILVVVVAVCLRRRAVKDREIEDDMPRILDISSPRPGKLEEPIPPVRHSSKGRLPDLPAIGSMCARVNPGVQPPPPLPGEDSSPSTSDSERSQKYTPHTRHSYQPLRRESLERVRYLKKSKSVSLYENTTPLRLSFPDDFSKRPLFKGSRKGRFAPISI